MPIEIRIPHFIGRPIMWLFRKQFADLEKRTALTESASKSSTKNIGVAEFRLDLSVEEKERR